MRHEIGGEATTADGSSRTIDRPVRQTDVRVSVILHRVRVVDVDTSSIGVNGRTPRDVQRKIERDNRAGGIDKEAVGVRF